MPLKQLPPSLYVQTKPANTVKLTGVDFGLWPDSTVHVGMHGHGMQGCRGRGYVEQGS